MNLPILYKYTNGQLRQWSVWVEEEDCPIIVVEHGLVNGKKQIKETFIEEGKNYGKSNATTAIEQAESEAASKWRKQIDKGYCEKDKLGSSEFYFRPMLAHRFDQHGHKIKYPAYIQCKLDGVRANLYWSDSVCSQSRKGKPFKVIDHITKSLHTFLSANRTLVLDGELFTRKLNFQEIISAIKRDEKNDLTEQVEYWIYDIYDSTQPNLPFSDRLNIIKQISGKYIKSVLTYSVDSKEKVLYWHSKNVSDGFEGSIVRNSAGIYKVDKRSYDLQKVKDFQDEEFKIVGIYSDKNNEAVFSCITKDGGRFDVKPEGDHQTRMNYLDKSNIGKMLTVRFFEWTTSDPKVPRFPVGVKIKSSYE